MQYMTIVLELLEQRKELHEQLRLSHQLLPTVESVSRELRDSHFAWKERLAQSNPASDPIQIASEALEMAIRELEERLPPVQESEHGEELSLDQAMAFLRNPSPRG